MRKSKGQLKSEAIGPEVWHYMCMGYPEEFARKMVELEKREIEESKAEKQKQFEKTLEAVKNAKVSELQGILEPINKQIQESAVIFESKRTELEGMKKSAINEAKKQIQRMRKWTEDDLKAMEKDISETIEKAFKTHEIELEDLEDFHYELLKLQNLIAEKLEKLREIKKSES
jgi:hypothetical protein